MPDAETLRAVYEAVRELATTLGVKPVDDLPEERGSAKKKWWATAWAYLKDKRTPDRLEEAAAAALDKQRAGRDLTDAEAEKARSEARLNDAKLEETRAQADLLKAEALEKTVEAANKLHDLVCKMEPGTVIQINNVCLAKPSRNGDIVAAVLSREHLAELERNPKLLMNPKGAFKMLNDWKNDAASDSNAQLDDKSKRS